MRVTCERCLRRYEVPDGTVQGRKIRARCKCGARVVLRGPNAEDSSPHSSPDSSAAKRPVRWFVDITSWEPIAMEADQLVRAFEAGRIDAETLVWRKGMPDWRRLREVEELAQRLLADADGHAPAAARNEVSLPSPPRPSRSRNAPTRSELPQPSAATGTAPGREGTEKPGPATLRGFRVADLGDEAPVQGAASPFQPRRTGTPAMGTRVARAALGSRRSDEALRVRARDVPASDETPAQKPSSISLRSEALGAQRKKSSGRPLWALAAAAAALVVVVQGVLVDEAELPSPPTELGETARSEAPRESSLRSELGLEPNPATESTSTSRAAAGAGHDPAGSLAPATSEAPRPPLPTGMADETRSKPTPAADAPRENERVAQKPTALTKRAAAPAPPPARKPRVAAARPARATTTQSVARLQRAKKPRPATSGTLAKAPSISVVPRPQPEPFQREEARRQMQLASGRASACGPSSRVPATSGAVRVVVEPWGRVSRVIHLNQAFVGTSLGLCVMEAFQKVRVPPFEGDAQTLSGSFSIAR